MNIYSLERVESDEFGYDEMYGCVIIAQDEMQAREYASKHCGDEGPDKWLGLRVAVRLLGRPMRPALAALEMVCRDFHAG